MKKIDFDNLTDDQLDRLVNDFKTINNNIMDGNLAMANQQESQDEGYTPFEMDLLNQITDLKKENVRLTKKLEYVYNKAYIIYHSANAEKCNSDIIKLWDAVEEFKPIEGAKKYGM